MAPGTKYLVQTVSVHQLTNLQKSLGVTEITNT